MIYLDNASTTKLSKSARDTIMEYLDVYGNPSSSYELGRESRLIIEDARTRIAQCINAEPNEIYFTSGGSEANTWAIKNRHSLASNIEHASIKADSYFKVDNSGVVDLNLINNWISHNNAYWEIIYKRVMSCMAVNNEIGTIQPIKEIAKIAHDSGAIFHTDAVQATGHIPIDVKDINCDLLSASAHKFNGPKGVGFLYIKNGTGMTPLIYGGKQERFARGGTENVIGIVSMAAALEDTVEHMEDRNTHIKYLRDKMLNQLLKIPGSYLNGSLEHRVVSNINIRFNGVSGQKLVALCDMYGICISSGSACHEGDAKPSHVLTAIGLSNTDALNSVRITIGHENTEEEIDVATDVITKLVERIREIDE